MNYIALPNITKNGKEFEPAQSKHLLFFQNNKNALIVQKNGTSMLYNNDEKISFIYRTKSKDIKKRILFIEVEQKKLIDNMKDEIELQNFLENGNLNKDFDNINSIIKKHFKK